MVLTRIFRPFLSDFDNLTSASPPNKQNFRRKQSDDAFVIHKVSTSPIKKPLTPTNNHPLQNLQEVRHEQQHPEEDEDDDDVDYFYEQKTAKNDENRNKVNYMMLNNKNTINLNNNKNEIMEQIDDNQNDSNSTTTKAPETHETGTGIVTKELEPDQVVRRQKKANATQKSNQRASFPMITKQQTNNKPTTVENPGFEGSDIEKLEGEFC